MPWIQNIYGNPYLNGSAYPLQKRYEVLSSFFASNSVAEAAFQNRVACDTANSYVNQFLRTGNCLPRKQGGANHVVVSDWIEANIEALLLCNPMLYLSEIRERVEDDLQLQPHEALSLSAICLCIQRLNFTSKKIVKIPMERYTAANIEMVSGFAKAYARRKPVLCDRIFQLLYWIHFKQCLSSQYKGHTKTVGGSTTDCIWTEGG